MSRTAVWHKMTEVTLRQYGPGCHTDLVAASGLRERKKEKTREALVDSALSQFTARGFDRVTVCRDVGEVLPSSTSLSFLSKPGLSRRMLMVGERLECK